MTRRGLLHTGFICANQRNFLSSVFFCDLHKTSPQWSMFPASSHLSVLSRTWWGSLDMHILCYSVSCEDGTDGAHHKSRLSLHQTDQSSQFCPHVVAVCFYFTAPSIGSSSTTMELSNRSALRLKPLYFLLMVWTKNIPFLYCLLFQPFWKRRLRSCAIPFSHSCMHTLFEWYIRQLSLFDTKKTKTNFFSFHHL